MQLLVLFFFLMLFMPQVYQGPRALLLLLVLFVTFKNNIHIYLNREVRTYWLLTYFVAIYAFIIGTVRGNVGLLPCTPFYMIWPILFLYFIIRMKSTEMIKPLLKTIVYGGLVVAVFNFVLCVNAYVLHIGILNSLGDALGCNFNIQEGFAEFFSPSSGHLAYIVYFSVALLLLNPETIGVKKKYLLLCVIFSIIDIVLSNRRAMWVVVLMLPFFLVLFLSRLPYHRKNIIKVVAITVAAAAVVGGVVMYLLDFEYVVQEFLSSFDFSGAEDSNLERTMQVKSLWNDFLQRPLLGSGIGHVSEYVRTPDGAWAYEMTYNYTLTMVGFIGVFIYTLATNWIYIKSVRLSKICIEYARLLIPQIMGLTALLIISASNPYIGTFDFVWTIYLPVATINAIWNEQRKAKACLRLS